MRLFLGMEGAEPGPQETGGASGSRAYRGWAEDRWLLGTGRESHACGTSCYSTSGRARGKECFMESREGLPFPWRELLWGKEGEISFKGEQGKWFSFSGC